MHAIFGRKFNKQYDAAPEAIRRALQKRIDLFLSNPYHPLLRNHTPKGTYQNCQSINVTGDWRAIYEPRDEDTAYFINLGTHSQLYK
jgi:addiction module RelE/StbE family toxin